MGLKAQLNKYFRSFTPPYSRKDILPISATLFFLAASPFAILATVNQPPQFQMIEEEGVEESTASFATNELLFKVKRQARGNIKEGIGKDIGISSLNSIVRGAGLEVKNIDRVTKPSNVSQTDSGVFSWYKLTFEGDREVAAGKLEQITGRLESDHPAALVLTQIIDRFNEDSNIESVEPNYVINILAIPNDPYYSSTGSWGQVYEDLWGMHRINVAPAWDVATGSASVVVANIDTGVDRNHEDMASNMWVNAAEHPTNGKDDDGNGYIDDYYGWDWYNSDNDPMDDHGHGSHTAGTIAGVGNNGVGVVGVNWTSKIMALKFLNSGGSGYLSDGISALQYAADMGARVSSNSWGCSCNSQAMDDAVAYQHDRGMVMVAAAGNNYQDALDFSPASADRAVTVAALDANDIKPYFSNSGQKIDVTAPGVDVLSLKAAVSPMCTTDKTVGTNYCRVSGTSMAAPHVAGLAALLLAKDPTLTNEEIRQLLRTQATDLGVAGQDRDFGYGRIDAGNTLAFNQKPLSPIITSPSSRTVVFGTSLQIIGSVGGTNFANYQLEIGSGRDPTLWTTIASSNTQVVNGVLATVNSTSLSEGLNIFRLTATDTLGNRYQFQVHDVEVDNYDAEITFPVTLASLGTVDILGTAVTKNGLTFSDYKIDWGIGSSPFSFSTEGITLANNGSLPITDGTLGTWDTSGLSSGIRYGLRLTVNATNGSSTEVIESFLADKDLVNGWPKRISSDGDISHLSPAIADLDGDGTKEVIVLAPGREILVFQKDGSNFPGFPVTADEGFYFNFSPSVDDLDGDGTMEIIASATDKLSNNFQRKIYIVRSDGTFYPGWPISCSPCFQTADTTPAVADLNFDSEKELVFVDDDGRVHAFQLDGTEIAGFPTQVPSVRLIRPNVAVTDMDNDDKPEIAIMSGNESAYLLDNTGNMLPGWPFIAPLDNGRRVEFEHGATFGDVDGDGNLEMFSIADAGGAKIYGWEKDGSLLPGWPIKEGYRNSGISRQQEASFADIDNDGRDELVVSTGRLRAYDLEGLKFTGPQSFEDPFISDIDGDGKLEYSASYGANIYWYNIYIVEENGVDIYWQRYMIPGDKVATPMVVDDLDGDGRFEMVLLEVRSWFTGGEPVVYLWEIPLVQGVANGNWPMFAHDAARTGNVALGVVAAPPPPPDLQIPTAPANLRTTNVTASQVDLVWDASTDNVGVTGYKVFRDGVEIVESLSISYGDATVTADTTYGYHISAFDAAGNLSQNSNTISVTTSSSVPVETAITGTVTNTADSSPIIGAEVTVSVSGVKGKRGRVTSATTNSSGSFAIILEPGTYDISAASDGFKKQTAEGVTLTQGQTVPINFALSASKGGGPPPGKGKNK